MELEICCYEVVDDDFDAILVGGNGKGRGRGRWTWVGLVFFVIASEMVVSVYMTIVGLT